MDIGLMGRRCTHMVIVWCVIPWYLGPRFLRGRGGDRDDNRHHPSAQVIRSGTICLSYLDYMNLDARQKVHASQALWARKKLLRLRPLLKQPSEHLRSQGISVLRVSSAEMSSSTALNWSWSWTTIRRTRTIGMTVDSFKEFGYTALEPLLLYC